MAKYKVIALSVTGKNNQVYRLGEVVDGSSIVGNPEDVEKQGFIKLIDPEVDKKPDDAADDADKSSDASTSTDDKGADDAATGGGDDNPDSDEDGKGGDDAATGGGDDDKGEIPAYDDISKKKIQAALKERGVDYDSSLNKQGVYDLLAANW